MSKRTIKKYVADFETVVEEDTWEQQDTEVWAWAITELFDTSNKVHIGNSLETFLDFITDKMCDKIIFFHNLKFDGSYILDYIIKELGFTPALAENGEFVKENKQIKKNQYTLTITDTGVWYTLTIWYKGSIIEFRDSLKLLPFKVSQLAKAFNTKVQKLEIDYKGHSKAGEEITREEQEYIKNDVLIVKEALEKFIDTMNYKYHIPLTISQAALTRYKKILGKERFKEYFPNIATIKLDPTVFGSDNADAYIRKSYYGGWCYVADKALYRVCGKTKITPENYIEVYDVNSLYPSSMHSKSKNRFPIGLPTFFRGLDEFARTPIDKYWFIRFRCNFKLKEGFLPFIQIKGNHFYRSNENLHSSFYDKFGEYNPTLRPELTLSKTMFNMFLQAYDISDMEIFDGCYFDTTIGLFDEYINYWFQEKARAKEEGNKVLYSISKLFQNSLYGKFGRNPINIFKVPHINSGVVVYDDELGEDNEPLFIPIASAITSYARRFTVSAAIENYEVFRYSDTDSIHLEMHPGYDVKGITKHNTDLCCWSTDGEFDTGIYLRQKTYMEYSINNENHLMDEYDIKACGMSERSKNLLTWSLKGIKPVSKNMILIDGKEEKINDDEYFFLQTKRKPTNFSIGLSVPGNLQPRVIRGGTVLVETSFTIN